MCLRSAFAVLFLACTASLWAQTNPPAQVLPYDQNFNTLSHASTAYPTGWRGWKLATTAPPDYRINPPTGNQGLVASQTAANTTGGVKNYNTKIGFQVTGALDCGLVLAVNTTGYSNVPVSYAVMTIRNPYNGTTNTRVQETTLQYRVGTAGNFTNLTGLDYQNNTTQQLTGTTPQNPALRTVTLPAACNNQPVVQLRWVMREVSGGGQRPSFAVDDVHVGPPCPPVITYPFTSYCINNGTSTPTIVGLTGGSFSSTAGLSINTSTGLITPATSTPGPYVVHYQVGAAGSCPAADVTANVSILPTPIANAGGPYTGCSVAPVSISATTNGTGTWSGGVGSFASATSPSTTYTPTAGETGSTVTLTWTTNDPDGVGGACAGTSSNASLFVGVPNPASAHGPYRSNGPAVVPINVTTGVAGTWSGGTGTFAVPTSASTTYTLGGGEAGTAFTLTWTNNNAGTCAVATSNAQFVAGGFGGGIGRGDVALNTPCPTATIAYSAAAFCTSAPTAAPTITGFGSGTFSSTAGLSINTSTGVITPATSTPGSYVVTYTIAASAFCPLATTTFNVSINLAPAANAGGPYFSGGAAVITVAATTNSTGTWSGGTGSFAVATNATTTYTLGGGEAGTAFSLTWTTNAGAGCTPVVSTAQVVGGGFGGGIGRGDVARITACPTATISYSAAAFCTSAPTAAPTITGYGGGTFSSTAGLSINASTGVITPATSTAGNYVVTYTIAATAFCPLVTTTFNVSITAVPTANAGGPYFSGGPAVITVVATANGAGTWSGGTGSFAAPTSLITTYTLGGGEAGTAFSLTWTTNAIGACAAVVSNAQVVGGGFGGGIGRGDVARITACPTATISYTSATFCSSAPTAAPTITGSTGGSFSSTAGLSINASTGVITPATSTPGNYVVTYTIPATAFCPVVNATFNITISLGPTANAGGPYFSGGPAVITVVAIANGAGTWSGGTGSFAVATNATTTYTLGGGEAGTAFSLTWTTNAVGGCAAVASNAQVVGGGFGGGIGRGDVARITPCPSATIAYSAAAFCTSAPTAAPTITGFGSGTFSSTAGLSINTSTGVITPATSTPGNYVVTYTIAASAFCALATTTFNVAINLAPAANAGGPYFSGGAAVITVAATTNSTGTWSGGTGSFAVATNATTTYTLGGGEAGTTFTLTWTTNAGAGCTPVVSTAQVVGGGFGGGIGRGDVARLTTCPTATIAYASAAYCVSSGTAAPTITGNGSGTFSSTAGLTINASTGVITPATSTPGNYVVTYTLPATAFCPLVTTTFNVSITTVPTANAGGPYFSGGPAVITVVAAANAAGTWSGGTGSFAAPASLITTYTLGGGEAGTAFSLTWTTNAATGCTPAISTAQVVGGGFGGGIGRGDVTTPTTCPAATIAYGSNAYCVSSPTATPTITGSLGGSFSSTAGLIINASTGVITPATSTTGAYVVTYFIPATAFCAAVNATFNVTITSVPTANAGGPYFSGGPAVITVVAATNGTGTWSGGTGSFTVPTNATTAYTLGGGEAGTAFSLTWTTNDPDGAGSCTSVNSIAQVVGGGFGGGIGRGDVALLSACPTATIAYSAAAFCTSAPTAAPTITGFGSGTFSSTAGLSINTSTGVITPATSTPGSYVVTYTIAASAFCPLATTTFNVSINLAPAANAGGPYFSGGAAVITVAATTNSTGTWSGGTGSFAVATNATTTYTLGGGEAGTAFSLTWTTNAGAGCTPVVSTAQVVGGGFGGGIGRGDVARITACPTATISYSAAAFCTSAPTAAPTITGYGGGTFSSTAGLSINASTGVITPATSTAGNYVVTYTIAATAFCPLVTTTFNVSITAVPTANAGGPYFSGGPAVITVVATANGAGTWSGGTGSFAAPTSLITTYTLGGGEAGTAFTLTWTTNAIGACAAVVSNAQVVGGGFGGGIGRGDVARITACPTATISYTSATFCSSAPTAAPTITGSTGGSFSSTAGLSINASTGVITPATSTPGNYVVTYTIPATAFCPVVNATFNITISLGPTANAGGPYFSGGPAVITVVAIANGAGTWSGGTGSFAVATNATTTYTLGGGEAGTAFSLTWTTNAVGGCAAVASNAQVVGGGFGGGIGRGDVARITPCPSATIAYSAAAFCTSAPTAAPTITGFGSGTFSSTAGLSINTSTGVITPATSTPGNYVVTYTIAASAFCALATTTFNVSINLAPTANAGGPYFSGGAAVITVAATTNSTGTWSGGTGSFAVATNATTTYTLGGGEAGTTFTLTWTTNAGAGCTPVVSTAQVVGGGFGGGIGRGDVARLTTCPTATIAYASAAYCVSSGTAAPTITGNGSGTFSSTAGLTINASTGVITPATSTPGNYVVTYTLPATAFCPLVTTTFNVSITTVPTANAGGPYFSGGPAVITVVAAANATGTWSGGTGSFAAPTSLITTYTLGGGEAGTAFSLTWTTNAATGCTPAISTAQVVGGGFGGGNGRGDVAVQFVAPPSIYYSRATGNVTDPIWNLTRIGPAGPAVFGPGTTMVVQIGDVVTNTSTADVYRLRVETGGTLAMIGGTAFNVWGDSATFSGTLNAQDNSALVLKSLSQPVKLVTTGTPSFFDLQVITPAGTTVVGNVDIRGTLQLDNGAFNANGWFVTLRSAATYTGRLGPVSPLASYVGNMKVERYIPGGATNWRLLGSPIAGKTVQNWQDDFITAGYPGSQFPTFDSPPGSGILWPSIRWYNETNPGPGQNDGLTGVSSNTQPLAQGQGFSAWSGDASGGTVAFIVDVQSGAPYVANTPIALPMSYTNSGNPTVDGWNLVSNPVPSPIAFSAINRGANVEDYVTFYNPSNGNMAVYDISQGAGTNGATNTIQSSQGFYLKANGAAVTTTIEEADKINANGGGIFGGAVEMLPTMLRLRIASAINEYSDEALITFHEGTPALDASDVLKLVFGVPEAPQVATKAGSSELAINAYGEMTSGFTVPVAVNVGVSGTYTLSLVEIGEVGLTCISLEDLETGAITPLDGDDSYSFAIDANDDATIARFLLHATAPFALNTEDALCGNDPDGAASVTIANGTADVSFMDAAGAVLLVQNGATGIVSANGLGAGDYTVQVNSTDACGTLVQNFSIEAPAAIGLEATTIPATCGDTEDGAIMMDVVGGVAPLSFLWSDGSTNEDLTAAAGNYSVTVTDANGCQLLSSAFTITHPGPTAGFTAASTVMVNEPLAFTNTSLNAADFAWDFGDGNSSVVADPIHAWSTPGTYTVTLNVTANGCSDTWAQPVIVETTTIVSTTDGTQDLHVWLADEQFVIEHPFNNGLPVLIDLLDATGRLHRTQQEAGFPGRVLLPAQGLSTGVWFVRITNDGTEHIVRVPLTR